MDRVLELLQAADGYLSGQAISEQLGVSRAAVWKHIKALQQTGYEIDSRTNRGYRLVQSPDLLTEQTVRQALGEHPWAGQIQVLAEVDSTNNRAKQLGSAGAPAGTVVLADRQSAGRGRLGQSFRSDGGMGVYLSALLRPNLRPDELPPVTALVAVAVCDAVQAVCGQRPQIKWTNDIILQQRKICGILTELSVEAELGVVSYLVVGAGVNVRQREADFPPELQAVAGSLYALTGIMVPRARLAAEMIRAFSRMEQALCGDWHSWMDQYRADCLTVGKDIQILRNGTAQRAHCDDLDETGALLVTYPDGTKERIFSGEVSVRGLYGYLPEAEL